MEFQNGYQARFAPSSAVTLSLEEWLRAAGTSLDAVNELAGRDVLGRPGMAEGSVRQPYLRMTGAMVNVKIKYTNGDPDFSENKEVGVLPHSHRTPPYVPSCTLTHAPFLSRCSSHGMASPLGHVLLGALDS